MSSHLVLIDDDTPNDDLIFPTTRSRGYDPATVVPGTFEAMPSEINLIPRSEWDARIDEQEKTKSSLEHVRERGNYNQPIPSLDQGQFPLCWGHSVTNAVTLERADGNKPYVALSAFGLAMTANGFKNQGGWCGLSGKQACSGGIPSQALWPQGDISRARLTEEAKADALKHRITSNWIDLTKSVWDQNLTFDQVATCLLLNRPCALDFNWWGHSVCGVRLVRVEAGSYGLKIWNSWSDSWGDKGMGVLRGSKAVPDGAICVRFSTAA